MIYYNGQEYILDAAQVKTWDFRDSLSKFLYAYSFWHDGLSFFSEREAKKLEIFNEEKILIDSARLGYVYVAKGSKVLIMGSHIDNLMVEDSHIYVIGSTIDKLHSTNSVLDLLETEVINPTSGVFSDLGVLSGSIIRRDGFDVLRQMDMFLRFAEATEEGYIFYKTFIPLNRQYYKPRSWKIKKGNILSEVVDHDRANNCSYGINVSSSKYLSALLEQLDAKNAVFWKVLIRREDCMDVCVPYLSTGQIRAGKITLLEEV